MKEISVILLLYYPPFIINDKIIHKTKKKIKHNIFISLTYKNLYFHYLWSIIKYEAFVYEEF